MTKRILLINSDLAKNRGDRAIAEGNVLLIKERFPDSIITGISQLPDRDKEWYGINFLNMNFQSINPFELLRLCKFAQTQDIVLWGGGEILKDYTNKIALWYWVLKMGAIRIFNKNIYGMFQGIGPTKSSFSRKIIALTVNSSKHFIVRDKESYEKLINWGVKPEKLSHASDPAILPSADDINENLQNKLLSDFNIDSEFLEDFICIGPRDWFHYKPGGLIPFKYRRALDNIFKHLTPVDSTQKKKNNITYRDQLEILINHIVEDLHINVLLVPMHMDESDSDICNQLLSKASRPERIRVLNNDTLSPPELRSTMSKAKIMIGFRLHSNIIAVSSNIPSLNVYYVDKGRVFFDQIKQAKYALPIEATLENSFKSTSQSLIKELLSDRVRYQNEISQQTSMLRDSIRAAFTETFKEIPSKDI